MTSKDVIDLTGDDEARLPPLRQRAFPPQIYYGQPQHGIPSYPGRPELRPWGSGNLVAVGPAKGTFVVRNGPAYMPVQVSASLARPFSAGPTHVVPSAQAVYPKQSPSRLPLSHPVASLPVARSTPQRAKHKTCSSCWDLGVGCDGEQPCANCVEPGVLCEYPGQQLKHGDGRQASSITPTSSSRAYASSGTKLLQIPTLASPSAATHRQLQGNPSAVQFGLPSRREFSTDSSQKHAQPTLPQFDSFEIVESLQVASTESRTAQTLKPQTREHEIDDCGCESETSELPADPRASDPEPEMIRRILQKHESSLRAHREYLLQPSLAQARKDTIQFTQSKLNAIPFDPFRQLRVRASRIRDDDSVNTNAKPIIQLQFKSHGAGAASKKWTVLSASTKHFYSTAVVLPKYKSIGRVGPSILAPNVRTLKYWPYFAEDEDVDKAQLKKHEELEQRYRHDDASLVSQRKCQELVDIWRPWADRFVRDLGIDYQDILYFLLQDQYERLDVPRRPDVELSDQALAMWMAATDEPGLCGSCGIDVVEPEWANIYKELQPPSGRILLLAALGCFVFHDVSHINMWHMASVSESVQNLRHRVAPAEQQNSQKSLVCMICYLHDCPIHGAYFEPNEDDPRKRVEVFINDAEIDHNIRQSATLPMIRNRDDNDHRCGIFCIDRDVRVRDILGQRSDGTVLGVFNHAVQQTSATFGDTTECGTSCFWKIERRKDCKISEVAHDRRPHSDLLGAMLSIHSTNKRGPCMVAATVKESSCLDAFYSMLHVTTAAHSSGQPDLESALPPGRKLAKAQGGMDTSLSAELDERPPFTPCSHAGACHNSPDCSCFKHKISCEWFCNCDLSCKRRYSGCHCAGVSKTCFNDNRCECWVQNRECDPWVCTSCGVAEVLDPANKDDGEIGRGRCRNNRLQLNLPARTIKAPSEVQGWGLFAGEDLDTHAFVGEYKGEIVSNQESDRRGAVYANLGQEYLFVMNREQQIDGSNFGNKTRFINNSQRDDYINVMPKKMLCNGVQRIMLYAKRPIKAGEELLYNYNYPTSVVKRFWERGEGPEDTNRPGAVVMKKPQSMSTRYVESSQNGPGTPLRLSNGRFAKTASTPDEIDDSADEENARHSLPIARRDQKRKRMVVADEMPVYSAANFAKRADDVPSLSRQLTGQAAVIDASDESDYEECEASFASEIQHEEADNSSEEQSVRSNSQLAAPARKRKVYPGDARKGGSAQRAAWATRKQQMAQTSKRTRSP